VMAADCRSSRSTGSGISHATALLGAGVDLKVASERLGHGSVRITADTYQHVERAMDEDAAARAAALVLG
jgi:integrase